jgi:hypothetical protein
MLADERRAHYLPVLLDEAAIRLVREDELRDAGHAERVDESGDDRHDDDHQERGADFTQH